jgi:HAD superfamily hydrolase (TIGR01509 family)
MMKSVGLVIFDCDGVVVDSEVLSCESLVEVLRQYDVPISLDDVFDKFLGKSFSVVEAYYREATGKSFPADLRTDYRDLLATTFRASLKPMPGIDAVLGALKLPYCLASSSDSERIATTLAAAGLAPYFGDRVYSAAMVAKGKPAPDLFLFAAAQMGREPRQTVVVEDTVAGVLAGKAAGMTVWGFAGGSHCIGRDVGRRLAEAGADRVFDSMADFMKPMSPG